MLRRAPLLTGQQLHIPFSFLMLHTIGDSSSSVVCPKLWPRKLCACRLGRTNRCVAGADLLTKRIRTFKSTFFSHSSCSSLRFSKRQIGFGDCAWHLSLRAGSTRWDRPQNLNENLNSSLMGCPAFILGAPITLSLLLICIASFTCLLLLSMSQSRRLFAKKVFPTQLMLLLVIQVSSLFVVSFSFLSNACTNVWILSLSASNGSIKYISQRNQAFYVESMYRMLRTITSLKEMQYAHCQKKAWVGTEKTPLRSLQC